MRILVKEKEYTKDEYFELEEASEVRHTFINGQLSEIIQGTKKHKTTMIYEAL